MPYEVPKGVRHHYQCLRDHKDTFAALPKQGREGGDPPKREGQGNYPDGGGDNERELELALQVIKAQASEKKSDVKQMNEQKGLRYHLQKDHPSVAKRGKKDQHNVMPDHLFIFFFRLLNQATGLAFGRGYVALEGQ